jgi:hypothetical protein
MARLLVIVSEDEGFFWTGEDWSDLFDEAWCYRDLEEATRIAHWLGDVVVIERYGCTNERVVLYA